MGTVVMSDEFFMNENRHIGIAKDELDPIADLGRVARLGR
jgi:hypothetical protein